MTMKKLTIIIAIITIVCLLLTNAVTWGLYCRERQRYFEAVAYVRWYSLCVDYIEHGTDHPYDKRVELMVPELKAVNASLVKYSQNHQ